MAFIRNGTAKLKSIALKFIASIVWKSILSEEVNNLWEIYSSTVFFQSNIHRSQIKRVDHNQR